MSISGFTYVHNALESGYPIVEAVCAVNPFVDEMVVVDMQSTDGTLEMLHKMAGVGYIDRIVPGVWQPGGAGACLLQNYVLNRQCAGDIVWHFEADEVYSETLVEEILSGITRGWDNIAVWRLQVEQNFQRIRWYPTKVHRIFPKASMTKDGETTSYHTAGKPLHVIGPEFGFLWDVTNCFRDNWFSRVRKNAELWGTGLHYMAVPEHCIQPVQLDTFQAEQLMGGVHWVWGTSPLDLPKILKPLVGTTKYRVEL